jgi:hypothetical protein
LGYSDCAKTGDADKAPNTQNAANPASQERRECIMIISPSVGFV